MIHKFLLDNRTLTLIPSEFVFSEYRPAVPGKDKDYIEEMIDTLFMRSLPTIMKVCFNTSAVYLFGNRSGYWRITDFVLMTRDDRLLMVETKKGKPEYCEIMKFIDYCMRFETFHETASWSYFDFDKGKTLSDSFKVMYEHGPRSSLMNREIVYYCSFFWKKRAQELPTAVGLGTHDQLRNDTNLDKWVTRCVEETAREFGMTERDLLENAKAVELLDYIGGENDFSGISRRLGREIKSLSELEAIILDEHTQLQPIWLVNDFSDNEYLHYSDKTQPRLAQQAEVVKYQLYVRKSNQHEYALTLEDPRKVTADNSGID